MTTEKSVPSGERAVEMRANKFTADEKKSFALALSHLEANKISDPSAYSGWYFGNKAQFIARYRKAVALLNEILKGAK